jgi:hypothetical protein
MTKRSPEQIKKLLNDRADRLKFFVSIFGKQNPLVEQAAYSVLETECGRIRAIWRYVRHALTYFFAVTVVQEFHWYRRWYWYRLVKRMSPAEIREMNEQDLSADCDEIEKIEKILKGEKK